MLLINSFKGVLTKPIALEAYGTGPLTLPAGTEIQMGFFPPVRELDGSVAQDIEHDEEDNHPVGFYKGRYFHLHPDQYVRLLAA